MEVLTREVCLTVCEALENTNQVARGIAAVEMLADGGYLGIKASPALNDWMDPCRGEVGTDSIHKERRGQKEGE